MFVRNTRSIVIYQFLFSLDPFITVHVRIFQSALPGWFYLRVSGVVMGGACSTNGEKRNAYKLLVGKLEGKRALGRPRRNCWTILE
jgi:hypothetical protein